jgi:hypothetical protein
MHFSDPLVTDYTPSGTAAQIGGSILSAADLLTCAINPAACATGIQAVTNVPYGWSIDPYGRPVPPGGAVPGLPGVVAPGGGLSSTSLLLLAVGVYFLFFKKGRRI